MEMQNVKANNTDTENPLRQPSAVAPPEERKPVSGSVSTLLEWFVRNSIPQGAADRDGEEAQLPSPSPSMGRRGGYHAVGFSDSGQRFETRFMASWQEVWNDSVLSNANSLADDVPLLYLVLYLVFHRNTIRMLFGIAVYVTIVTIVGSALWGSQDGLIMALTPSVLVFVCLPSMITVTKGSFAAKTIRFNRAQLSLFTSRQKEDTENLAQISTGDGDESPTVGQALWRTVRLVKRLLVDIFVTGKRVNNTTKLDYAWERKFKKSGTVGIESYIEIAENVSGYLKTVYSMDAERIQGRAFVPRAYTTYVTLFGVLLPVFYGFYYLISRWYYYAYYCDMFTIYDVSEGTAEEQSIKRWCNRHFFEVLLFGGDLISTVNQVMCTCAYFACLALFMYGVDLTISLMKFFVLRYQSMRQFEEANMNFNNCTASTAKITASMRRDAFERYLFIKHFLDESSRLWAPFLLVSWSINALLIAAMYFTIVTAYAKYGFIDATAVLYFIIGSLTAFYLLALVSMTNTAVELIANAFKYSGLDDYSLIGGRSDWVAYLGEAPLYWTVMGFVITPAWLSAFCTTVATGVASVFILPMFS